MAKYGIIVAEENDDVSSSNLKRLESEKKQFKYRKIIDFKFPVPAISIGTNWNKTIQAYYNEDKSSIGFVPAYEYYVKSYSGNWSIPIIPSPQVYESSTPEAPFYKEDEFVTDKYMNIKLLINNQNLAAPYTPTYAYPAYIATLRLIITFDNLALV